MKVTNVIRTKIRVVDGDHAIYAEFVRINPDGTLTYKLSHCDISQDRFQPVKDERIVQVDELITYNNLSEAWRLSNIWLDE